MKKLILILSVVCIVTIFLIVNTSFFNEKKTTTKKTQIRIFTINKGKMDIFLDAWQKGVYPLRIKSGFKIEGAWVVQEKNKFIWILSYDGPEGFEAKDSAYYASQARTTLKPDPADYIADAEKYFISPGLP
ncbi:MAG TPA: hypothetical protein VGQ09_20255 [Chitinophagaceae bacterium]|jgi:hypothetical protein|nr:hypothetical protein [Chitinophagaceae bacterium]